MDGPHSEIIARIGYSFQKEYGIIKANIWVFINLRSPDNVTSLNLGSYLSRTSNYFEYSLEEQK